MTTAAEAAALDDVSDGEPGEQHRGLGLFLAIAGGIGVLASTILTIDKINLLEAEAAGEQVALGCDLNAFVSCSGVIASEQAEAFGFPNPLMGIAGFAVVATLGVLLASGLRLPGWVWGGLQAGTVFGIAFVTWLQYQSIFTIGRLCPYCMVVWAVMIPIFVLVTARNVPGRFLRNWSALIIALWYIAVAATIFFVFGDTLWA
ncbi:vitamin K epoxide reductase family protein [Aeromicrobium phragmitis]|uniref:Vitamin K epoxide reductase family protein n=1 Tax=Aeromicrobium phragmitis TaxID=2478914 RepID=A0A3L8PPC6_9ACTN|nr:vitamin K epoxide reductase family protein [Aeromicrobium phragmitis]RLV56679.1 vitamin K epoxide reductase family protein [Aeromicrobium phragmitis]